MKPHYFESEEYKNRLQKLEEISSLGIEPYPHCFKPTHSAEQIAHTYQDQTIGDSEAALNRTTPHVKLAGRLVLFRAMGTNAFAHLRDGHSKIQIMFNKEHTHVTDLKDDGDIKPIKFIEKKIDLGDMVGVEGHLFRTHKGEITLFVKQVTLLCKSLLPLPEKHSGLTDKQVRYRKRWLDLISHDDVYETFVMRSKMMHVLRQFMAEHRFMEVETPILQHIYGGAEARPFTSHINAISQDVFLRISLEIPLKKLLVGGMERVFEIGKVFRNEGIDRTHNPEFTMIEAYAAYWDYNDMMVFVEKLIEKIALALYGTTKITYVHGENGEELSLNFASPWKRMT